MIVLKSAPELAVMRVAGSILAVILEKLTAMVRPGLNLAELDRMAEELALRYGARPAFKGYHGFPASICTSLNEEVVHGIPAKRVLKGGSIIGLDFGLLYQGFYADAAITLPIGEISPEAGRLLRVTQEALQRGTEAARPGNRLYDISGAIQRHVEGNSFSVVVDYVGHGIGRQMHEDPQIPNFVGNDFNPKLKPGMVLAIEPMVNAGAHEVNVDPYDKWTVRTADRKFSAHFEHTVAVTDNGPEILTLLRPELVPKVGD
jgi:methionyl aminopeptidase